MYQYILIRFLQSILSLYVLLTIVFFSARLSGDPLDLLLGENATKEQEAKVRAYYGLDKPMFVQYRIYLGHLIMGDLGRSIQRRRPVTELIIGRIGASMQLIGAAMVISLSMGVIIGVYCAINRGRLFDLLGRSFAALGQSFPVFWFGLMLMLVFAVWLDLLPTSGRGGLKHIILPAVTLAYALLAGILRLTRSAMLDVLDSEYVKLARIKGVSEFVVIWKHAFRNALLPVVTYSVVLLASVVASAVVTETVFSWPGLGQLVVQAVVGRDFPLIQGIVLFVGSFVLIANLIVDILYVYLDPKIRYTD